MKESTKGALLSFLVYPGVGQLVLGLKFSGILFALLTTAGLLVIMYRITLRIFHAIDPILLSLADNTFNFRKIIEILDLAPYESWRIEGLSLAFLILFWFAAGMHAYIAGGRIDRKEGRK